MSLALSHLSAHRLQTQVQRMLRNAGGGAMFRFSPVTCWTDTSRTSAAASGNAVATLDDLSGYGNHMFQATSTARPLLSVVGGYYAGVFDGADDLLQSTATFDIKAGAYLAVATSYTSGSNTGATQGFALQRSGTNFFVVGQQQSTGRARSSSRGGNATPSTVGLDTALGDLSGVVAANTPYVVSGYLTTTSINVKGAAGVTGTSTSAPFGSNVSTPATLQTNYATYAQTMFGAVYCPDYTKVDDAVVRAWLRSISGAA